MPSSVSGDLPEITESTRRAITLLLRHGPMGRSELAGRLLLTKGALTKLTKQLLEIGLLEEVSNPERGVRGWPTLPLAINRGWSRFVGVKLTGDRSYAVLTDLSGAIVRAVESPLSRVDPTDVLAVIVSQVNDLTSDDTAAGLGVAGPAPGLLSLSLAGPVIRSSGRVVVLTGPGPSGDRARRLFHRTRRRGPRRCRTHQDRHQPHHGGSRPRRRRCRAALRGQVTGG